MNRLHFGDNLDVLRGMPSEFVDLVYLDPPFNSNVTYNVLYGTKRAGPSQAQSHGFEDTWRWGTDARRALEEVARRHIQASKLLDAFRNVFGDSAIMAYLAMMGVRLIELHRVLKFTGSLYLHCDPRSCPWWWCSWAVASAPACADYRAGRQAPTRWPSRDLR